ncbi:uncharacterized protein [Hoplias malabaricus]
MASAVLRFLAVFLVTVCSAQKLLELECQPAVGVIGKITKIPCSFKIHSGDLDIRTVIIRRKGQINKVVYINTGKNIVEGDPRIQLVSRTDPSLLFTNTAVSDEGEYEYKLETNRGEINDGRFKLRVKARYSDPTISSSQTQLQDACRTELHCSTSGGYPAGGIHWFDSTGANWTERATLEITKRDDRLLTMFSNLNLTVDSGLRSFRCIVLSSEFTEEGMNTLIVSSSRELCVVQFCLPGTN